MAETITRGRRVKHIDHYVGPGVITRHIGTRSMVIRLNGKHFQRDAGMIMLEKPKEAEGHKPWMIIATQAHSNTSHLE